MYVIQNAWRNVLRNKGRNILLGCIILLVIVAAVTALIISNTSRGIIEDYKARFGSEVTLQPDMQKMQEEAMANSTDGRMRLQIPEVPTDQYIAFGDSDYLQSASYSAQAKANSDDLEAIDAEKGGGGGMMLAFTGAGPGSGGDSNAGDGSDGSGDDSNNDTGQPQNTTFMFSLLAGAFGEFADGSRSLAEGEMPQNSNECLISSDLAELNGVKVGDSITLTSELTLGDFDPDNADAQETREISYQLKVVGIYDDATEEYANQMMQNAYTNRRNEILTTFDTVVAPLVEGWSGISVSATYYLKDPEMLEAFAQELYDKGLSPIFNVSTDSASYNRIVAPVENLKNIALIFVVVVLVIGAVVIALLASVAVRERKYEIGVLRAMGMKKGAVSLGLFSELLMVTLVCLVIGLGIGTLVARPVSNFMLESQIAATEAAQSQGTDMVGIAGPLTPSGGGSGGGGMQLSTGPIMSQRIDGFGAASTAGSEEALKSLDASLGWDSLLEIILAAFALSSIAGLIATAQITKYEPIKILMERN